MTLIIGGLLAIAILVFILALPTTWLAMLFAGNIGLTHLGFWDLLPGVIAAKAILATNVTNKK